MPLTMCTCNDITHGSEDHSGDSRVGLVDVFHTKQWMTILIPELLYLNASYVLRYSIGMSASVMVSR